MNYTKQTNKKRKTINHMGKQQKPIKKTPVKKRT